jgi:tetratricopeptide (TPR) repeat protein
MKKKPNPPKCDPNDDGCHIINQDRPGTRDFPYVVSPRQTTLLSDRPSLQWSRTADVRNYTVMLRSAGQSLWQVTAPQNDQPICELDYPADQPPLQPGKSYVLVITADNDRSSDEESVPGLGFSLLDAETAKEVTQRAQAIDAQDLPALEKMFARTELYWQNNLRAEAIQLLITLPPSDTTAKVHRWVANMYRANGLLLEAEEEYAKAINLTQVSQNKPELAGAKVGLGQTLFSLGQLDEAAKSLTEAKSLYQELGDEQSVTKVEGILKDIEKAKEDN